MRRYFRKSGQSSLLLGFGFCYGSFLLVCQFNFRLLDNFRLLRKGVYAILIEGNGSKTSRLTTALTKVGQVLAADLASLNNFDFGNKWRVQQIGLFDTNTASDAANSNAAGQAVLAVGTNNDTLEHLNALFAAFTDFLVDLNSVTSANINNRVLAVLLFNFLD